MDIHYTKQHIHCARMNSGVLGAGGSGLRLSIQQYINPLCYISVSSYFVIVGYMYITVKVPIPEYGALSYNDTNLGGPCSLYQSPNQTESSPQVREVRRKKRVVLQRCRGLGLYMVSGSATVLFLRETHTWC